MGCWTPCEGFARAEAGARDALWTARAGGGVTDFSQFDVLEGGQSRGTVRWELIGAHNMENALAAIAAARHSGVPVARAIEALESFKGIARRMQLRGEVKGVRVYDDFAHHPTAIATTIDGLRRRVGSARIIAVLEPRSNTMKMGVHQTTLGPSLMGADEVWLFAPADLGWDAGPIVASLGARGHSSRDIGELAATLAKAARPGDHVLIMSNGGFGGLHDKLLQELRGRGAA
jgi:UDP-N-acetylmuramate: L-alanyl-gamma-D-glutamyl-meso-diaminopimelate ligase